MAEPSDPAVRPEDFLAFLKGYHPERGRAGEQDMLAGRWRIFPGQPIPEFSSSYARAYAARDEKAPADAVYALVFEDGVPLRQKNITALKAIHHPSLVNLLGEGSAAIGAGQQARYVVVLEKPEGQPLSQILEQKAAPLPESLILQQFLRPIAEILSAFTKQGISHNRIHPGNIYVSGNSVTLGECVSEPSGFSQDPLFEPIERMLTLPRAKADFAPGADCYALAVLALHLTLGFMPFALTDKEKLIHNILNTGAYHTLVLPWDMPADLQDLLRGAINDGRRERWDTATLESWLSGRRFNIVMPAAARETARAFEFGGEMHYTRKSIAHSLSRHWKEAMPLLTDHRLTHWLKIHAHKQDTADAIARLTQAGAPLTPLQEEDALARIIIALDPGGPVRFRQVSTSAESIGALLAHALIAERHDDVQTLTQMIETDLAGFWVEQQKPNPEHAALTAKLQKARSHLRLKGLGFGMERCLYDLNPSLPCLSPMLAGHHVGTLAEMLTALDAISAQKGTGDEVGDRHIAAFIANRLGLDKEVHLPELHSLPELKNHPTFLMLRLLAKAQGRSDGSYKGLCHWLALRLLPLLANMHNRVRQRMFQTELRAAAVKGSLAAMANLLLSSQAFEADQRDFQKATTDYAARRHHIAALKSNSGLALRADVKGRGVAQSIAYGICLATVYVGLKAYFHL